jgi:iron complex outermembrane recepter protein
MKVHSTSISRSSSALVLALALAAVPGVALAQAAEDSSDEGGIADIVVTARKRAESVQDIPVAVTAYSEEAIRKADLTSLDKLAAATPNFLVGRASNGSGAQLTLRGIGTSSTSIGIEQSVAVIVDGVYYGQGRIIQEGFFDLARLEVLKGPQALFFGKNATAGVISITTADPGPDAEFIGRASYEFKAKQVQLEAIASGPLSDTVGARIAVRGSKMFGGYYRNDAGPQSYSTFDIATSTLNTTTALPVTQDQPGEKELLARATLKFTPTNDLTMTFKYGFDYNRAQNSSWNYVAYRCATGFSTLRPTDRCGTDFVTRQVNFPTNIAANFPFARKDGQMYNRYRSHALTANVNYELDNVTLTSVTNYNTNNNRWGCNCDFQANPGTVFATENSTWRAFSSELRALTNFDGAFNVLAGAYYQKTKRKFDQFIAFGNVEDSSQSPANRYVATGKSSFTDGKTLALFGQAIARLGEKFEATAGLRYTHETKDSQFSQPIGNAALAFIFRPATDPLGIVNANQKFNNVSPEVTVSYKPNRNVMVYGAFKSGYKSGGFSNSGINSAFSTNPLDDLTFDEEKAHGFEGGIKSTLADKQLRLNLIGYTYTYRDLQVDFFNSPIFAFQTLTADARTQGFELEAQFAPRSLEGFEVHTSLNYNRAKYTSFPAAPCYSGQTPTAGCNLFLNPDGTTRPITGAEVGARQNLAGQRLANAPLWAASFGFSYESAVGTAMKWGLNADTRFSDSYIASGFGNPFSNNPSYATLDVGIRIGAEDDRWQLALVGKNLTNRFYVSGVVDGPSTGSGTGTAGGIIADQLGFGNVPRTVKIEATVRF